MRSILLGSIIGIVLTSILALGMSEIAQTASAITVTSKSGARACTGTACTQGPWSACTACSSNGNPVAFNAPSSSSKNPELQGSSAAAAAGSSNFCPGGKPHAVTNDHAVCAP